MSKGGYRCGELGKVVQCIESRNVEIRAVKPTARRPAPDVRPKGGDSYSSNLGINSLQVLEGTPRGSAPKGPVTSGVIFPIERRI